MPCDVSLFVRLLLLDVMVDLDLAATRCRVSSILSNDATAFFEQLTEIILTFPTTVSLVSVSRCHATSSLFVRASTLDRHHKIIKAVRSITTKSADIVPCKRFTSSPTFLPTTTPITTMLTTTTRTIFASLFIAVTIPGHVTAWSWSTPPLTRHHAVGDNTRLHCETAVVSRRNILATAAILGVTTPLVVPGPVHAKDLSEEYRQGTLALQDMDDQAPVPREAYVKLPSGVVYADLRPGKGATVGQGSKVNLQWVLRKSNGYFVDSSAVQDDVPFIFSVGDGTAIAGLDQGIRGMQEGGVRRILMPPSLAYVEGLEDGKPGPLPTGYGPRQQMRRVQTVRKDVPGEYVFLEVQATRVR